MIQQTLQLLFTLILTHKLILLETILFITIITSSLYIYKKTINYYKLSKHKGLKYFALTFLYLGLSALINFITKILNILIIKFQLDTTSNLIYLFQILEFSYNYSITIASFLLIYSLVWKDLEKNKIKYKITILQISAIIITILNLKYSYILYTTNIILLVYGIIIAYTNHLTNKNQKIKNPFSQLYLISLILIFLIYFSNFLVGFFPILKIYQIFATILIFLIFFYGAINPQIKTKQKIKQ